MSNANDGWVSVRQGANLLGISVQRMYQLVRTEKVRSRGGKGHVGGTPIGALQVSRDDLIARKAALTDPNAPPSPAPAQEG